MIDKESTNGVISFITFIWVIGIASWGGMVSYFYKMDKEKLTFSIMRLSIEMMTSAFVGLLTYLLCSASNISPELTAPLVGLSGHMGTRALFLIEKKYSTIFKGNDNGNK